MTDPTQHPLCQIWLDPYLTVSLTTVFTSLTPFTNTIHILVLGLVTDNELRCNISTVVLTGIEI